jgi:hypothetical protein
MHSYSHLYLPKTRLHVSISRALPLALASWRIFPHYCLRLVAYSVLTESISEVTSFRPLVCHALRAKLSTGFSGGEPWSPFESPGPYPVPFWASLLAYVDLFPLTAVSFVRLPAHRHLLAGVAWLGSRLTRFSSRFPRLRTSRTQGDDAVPCSQGVGDCTQRRVTSCQSSWSALQPLCRTSPDCKPVSSERIAPKVVDWLMKKSDVSS